jgi:LPXTG-motif cell wall-anchored protein
VNIDTDAKPTFYYAVEDKAVASKSVAGKIVIIAGVVLISAVCGFVLLRKKKK